MVDPKTPLLILALSLVATAAAAETPRYRNFDLAIYARVDDVRQMSDKEWLESRYDVITRHLKLGKIYLETHRGLVTNDFATMRTAKEFFESRGIRTAGGITTVWSEGREFQSFCYSNPEHRKKLDEIVTFTALLFDELILDDFFFTTCKCDLCIRAKGEKSWSDFRVAQMREAAQSLVLSPARRANPKVKVVIKYPNWYEHFPHSGFDLEGQPTLFDGIYTGNETRDPRYTHQHLQEYQSYSIQRYFENVAPGRNGGGWVDPYARRTLDRYADQLVLTLLGRARELTLFCFSDLFEAASGMDPRTNPASQVIPLAGDVLARTDALLSQLGQPVGVTSYKPYHSSGEDFFHSHLGMIGIPVEMTPEFREESEVMILAQSAAEDPTLISRMKKQLVAGRTLFVTSGLLRALAGRGIEDIVELEVLDQKAAVQTFSDFRSVSNSTRPILIPQIRYATNDSWEDVMAISGQNGSPLLLHASYSKGRLYVLSVPDTMSEIYDLPSPALDRIRQAAQQGQKVRLAGQSRVALFTYDNDTLVVRSFREESGSVDVLVEGRDVSLVDLATGQPLPGASRGTATAFPVWVAPHQSRAFRFRAAPKAGATDAYAMNRKIGRGVNIIGYDPIWKDRSTGRFQEKHFRLIASAGLQSVRINLHPFRYMDAADGYRLQAQWLATLDWAVDNALAAGLAPILDLHEFGAMAEDPLGRKEMFLSFWRQVAPRFASRPPEVLFELLNEPHGKLTPELWNDFLREGLAVIRETNPTRTVILGPGQWNGIGELPKLVLPDEDRNIIVTVHYYHPMEFTHQGAPWTPEFERLSGVSWMGTEQEMRRVRIDFAAVQRWAAAHDRPVYLGEFGVYDKADMDSRARYTRFVARTAEESGWSFGYWQFDSDFVLYDIAKDAWVKPILEALVK